MPFILPFAQLKKDDILLAGGKGANLGELTAVGLSVPPGFVITTAAYDAFVAAHELQPAIIAAAGEVSTANPASSASAADTIKALFVEREIAPALAEEIGTAYRALTAGQDAATEGDAPVAVRSSATAEDLPTASFAGQQDTFLNIQGEETLLAAVKACWASLWTARAIAYRQRQGIDPAAVSLAVVVQALIPADAAGVLFTANPISGARDELLINATWGLGEAIVGGEVTPDTIVVDKASEEILSRETAVKAVMTVQTATGTEEQPVPEEKQAQPALDDETAVALAHLGARIEDHYGQPMDIEWAVAGGDIAILQARPITALPDPQPAAPEVSWEPTFADTIWMRRQIVEHMPEPLSPLFEDLYLRQGLDETMDGLMGAMAKIGGADIDLMAMMPQGFATTVNGYAYTTASFSMSAEALWAILRIYSRIYKFFSLPDFDYDGAVLPRYQALIAHWAGIDLVTADDETLLEGIAVLAEADSRYWFGSAANLGLSRIMDPVFDRFLRSALVRQALPEPRPVSASFLRGFDSKAIDAQADMEALAEEIRASAALSRLVADTPAERLLDALAEHPEGTAVNDNIQAYFDAYGHQIYNLDFVAPTQIEDPLPMLLSLKALVTTPPEQPVRRRQAQMAAERDRLVAETAARLNPISRWLFLFIWKWTKRYAPYREQVMFYMGAGWPTVRRLATALGERLATAGVIDAADDIYYLNSAELKRAIAARANGDPLPAYRALVEERRALRSARQRLAPPARIPQRATMKFGPFDLSAFDPTPTEIVAEGPVLQGHAVSTGRVTAPASVIRSTTAFDQMQPGTVLVATTTTPAWTPLFSQAVGLVTDIGGALAHGSIVAREYGIPAVMGTGVATDRIRSGMMLTVDGDAGTVTLVDEVEEGVAVSPAMVPAAGDGRKRALLVAAFGLVAGFLWWKRRRTRR